MGDKAAQSPDHDQVKNEWSSTSPPPQLHNGSAVKRMQQNCVNYKTGGRDSSVAMATR